MIHPSSASAALVESNKSVRSLVFYYIVSLVIASFSFIPLITHGNSVLEPVPKRTIYLLISCSILATPLLLEYMVDLILWYASSRSVLSSQPRLGNFVMLISMFLPVCILQGTLENAECRHSALFVNCFVSFLHAIIIIAQYRKLQDRHWSIFKSLICISFYVASQICSSYAVIYSMHSYNSYNNYPLTVSLALYFAFAFICTAFHRLFSKQYLFEYVQSFFRDRGALGWDTNDYVFFCLQFITAIYFIVNFITAIVFLVNRYDSQYYLNTGVITHIVLGLTASILPGRMVQKNLYVLNVRIVC